MLLIKINCLGLANSIWLEIQIIIFKDVAVISHGPTLTIIENIIALRFAKGSSSSSENNFFNSKPIPAILIS